MHKRIVKEQRENTWNLEAVTLRHTHAYIPRDSKRRDELHLLPELVRSHQPHPAVHSSWKKQIPRNKVRIIYNLTFNKSAHARHCSRSP